MGETRENLTGGGLEDFERLAWSRRATRHFQARALPEGMLERLLEAARWAPSGYNLQPTHFVVATDAALRERLRAACMDQAQVTEAPAVVVFTGDRRVRQNNFDRMIAAELAGGSMTAAYEGKLRHFVPLAFDRGPLGIHYLWKRFLVPLVRLVRPVPEIPAVRPDLWLNKQVALSAMSFMLAARAAGLDTCPMEGFDTRRVRQVLGIPRSHSVVMVVPVGYAVEQAAGKTRLPLEEMLHLNGW